jgi:hypothetical protein
MSNTCYDPQDQDNEIYEFFKVMCNEEFPLRQNQLEFNVSLQIKALQRV